MTQKIVKNGIKMDLHIHSSYSISSDAENKEIKNNTFENIEVLLNNLIDKDVEVFSITDYNVFDKDLFINIKEKIIKENRKIKILPGIEFTIVDESNQLQNMHVVVIFDDDEENIQKVHNEIYETNLNMVNKNEKEAWKESWIKNRWNKLNKKNWTIEEFKEFWNKNKIPIVTIAHQKSIKSLNKKSNDLVSLKNTNTTDEAYKIISMMYIDALEYKNRSQERFAKIFIDKKIEIPFVTGSDCHNWSKYNYEDHSYYYCLPTFKGLMMSISSYENRIKKAKKFIKNPYLKSITIKNRGSEEVIELSKKINVVIGDNGSGKSTLLKNIFGELTQTHNWHSNFNIKIEPIDFVENDISTQFFKQGDIRLKSQNAFSDDVYPKLDTYGIELLKNKVKAIIDDIDKWYKYKNLITKINKRRFKFTDYLGYSNFRLTNDDTKFKEINKNTQIDNLIQNLQQMFNVEEIQKIESLKFNSKEISEINKVIQILETKKEKIREYNSKQKKIDEIRFNINEIFEQKQETFEKYKTDSELLALQEKNNNIQIIKLFNEVIDFRDINMINWELSKDEVDALNKNNFVIEKNGEIKFITKIKFLNDSSFTTDYLIQIFRNIINKNSIKNICPIEYMKQKENWNNIIVNGIDIATKDQIRDKLFKLIDSHFEIIKSLSDTTGNDKISYGQKSRLVISNLHKNEYNLIVIDQPEDDISNIKIKKFLMNDLRKLSNNKQIIIITHNPQLVVDLDVENVILLKEKSSSEMDIYYGSLEYVDEKINILHEIETLLDGGKEAVNERIRKYD